jgi:DNA repair protein RecO (recombination protein O)
VITKIYTDLFGLQSYIVNNVRSSKPKYNIALFQPLTQLELVAYHNPHGKMNRVTEIKLCNPYHDIPFNIRKSTVSLFLAEMLVKTLKEETSNNELFNFISRSLSGYDDLKDHYQNFHVQFLLKYLKFMGLELTAAESLFEGNKRNSGNQFFNQEILRSLVNEPYGSGKSNMDKSQRLGLLELITGFISHHMGIEETFKSLKILKEVFE